MKLKHRASHRCSLQALLASQTRLQDHSPTGMIFQAPHWCSPCTPKILQTQSPKGQKHSNFGVHVSWLQFLKTCSARTTGSRRFTFSGPMLPSVTDSLSSHHSIVAPGRQQVSLKMHDIRKRGRSTVCRGLPLHGVGLANSSLSKWCRPN